MKVAQRFNAGIMTQFRVLAREAGDRQCIVCRPLRGLQVHPLLNYTHGRHALSLVTVKGRQPGMSYSIRF